MPWTLAHPAAVLPLRRWPKYLPFTGLVVGSMAPDFGYYTGHFDLARDAHSPLGLLALCLPTGLLVVLLLRRLRRPLIELLPQPHRAAFPAPYKPLNRPGARNALSSTLIHALRGAMRELDEDNDVDVIVLTGADPAFCAGLDLKEMGAGGANLELGSSPDGIEPAAPWPAIGNNPAAQK